MNNRFIGTLKFYSVLSLFVLAFMYLPITSFATVIKMNCADFFSETPKKVFAPANIEILLNDPKQVVIFGKLDPVWFTGMEEKTAWSIVEPELIQKIGLNAAYPIQNGDLIYLYGPSGNLLYYGYYFEYVKHSMFRFPKNRAFRLFRNHPILVESMETLKPILDSTKFKKYFYSGLDAVVVHAPKN